MILLNTKNHQILTHNLEIIDSFWGRSLGLHRKNSSDAIVFKTRFGIHTFGLKRPIDIIICDGNLRVQAFHKDLSPNKICLWNPRYNVVFELPAGSIQKSEINLGDTLNIHQKGETW